MAENDTLSPAQRRSINALLTERNTRDAAKVAKVSERSLWRWLADPAFRAELTRQEGAVIDQVTRGLLTMQGAALDAVVDVFNLADEQARVNIADFISEEPRAVNIGKGEQAQTVYLESGSLDWEKIRERGHLVKKIQFNQYGPVLELYDSQTAAGLKLQAAKTTLDYLLRLRELNTLEQRIAKLEEAQNGKNQ